MNVARFKEYVAAGSALAILTLSALCFVAVARSGNPTQMAQHPVVIITSLATAQLD